MSYCVMISTYKKVDKYSNKFVNVEDICHICNSQIPFNKDEHGYFLERKSDFTSLYFPNKKIRGKRDKNTLIEVIKEINLKFLMKNIFFVDLGEDETIHKNEVCDINEFVSMINNDSLEPNVLYKIKHEYFEYNR